MTRTLRILFACLALCAATATVAGAALVNGYSGPLRATLHAGTHHPKAGRRWPLQVTASYGGRAARASAYYRYLFQGQVVSTQTVNGSFRYVFSGAYHDFMIFPARAVGEPITVQVVISERGRTVYLNWPIQVVR